MKQYIKRLRTYQMINQYGDVTGEQFPSDREIMAKINEVIGSLTL